MLSACPTRIPPPTATLWRRPQSRSIWFRMAVPTEHQDHAGKKIIQCSLGTDNRREASILAGKMRADLFEQWRGRAVPSERDLEEAATIVGYDWELEGMDKGRRAMRGMSLAMWAAHTRFEQSRLAEQAQRAATGDSAAVATLADDIVDALRWALPKDSEGYSKLCELLNDASLAARKVSRRRHAGEVDADTDSKLVQRVRQRENETAPGGQTIIELFDRYAAQRLREGKPPDSVQQERIVVEQFADFAGNERRLGSITRDDVRDWRDAMAAMPRNYRNANAYKGLNMRAAAAKAIALGAQTLSPVTQNKNMSAVSPFFGWAVRNGYAEGNPCDGLFLALDKTANVRDPFTVGQLNEMLQSPLFTGFLKDEFEHKSGNVHANDWRRWIPLVAMFTGARIGEIAQLRLEDLEEQHGRWFIHIRDDAKTGQRTKSGKSRMVPVHSALRGMGFLRFHADQLARSATSANRQLFPELEVNARDHIGAQPSRFWRVYLSRIGVKNGGDGLGAHAFRHTMADELRAAGFLDDQFGPLILGHHKGSVTGKYGRLPRGTADMLCAMIDKVEFKGVDYRHLMTAQPDCA